MELYMLRLLSAFAKNLLAFKQFKQTEKKKFT